MVQIIQLSLDIGCFGPLESAYNKLCSAFLRRNVDQEICILNACKAYSLVISPNSFDSSVVPEKKKLKLS
ncbi:hypothetical protein KUTeg_021743, partial [Tegillarca granosa]